MCILMDNLALKKKYLELQFLIDYRLSRNAFKCRKQKKDDDSDWEDNISESEDDDSDWEDNSSETKDNGSESEDECSELEDGDTLSDDESICASSSDDDMCIEKQKILEFPLKRTVRRVQKGQRHGRAPRLGCYPLVECRKIAGFEEFVAWVAKFHTDDEKTHNNNISSVRTFMQMLAGSDRPFSMRLLTSPDQIIKHMDLIKE
jgi:hypothetical protein